MQPLKIKAEWDNDKAAWVATGDILYGRVIVANTIDELIERLKTLIPDLMGLDRTELAGDDQAFMLTKIWPVHSYISLL